VGHLLAPGQQLAAVLPGCAVLVSAFRVDHRHETFLDDEHEGQHVPNKVLLDRIANLLGVSWRGSSRTDHGRDPCVRSYSAEGAWRDFDASERKVQGSAGIDLSPGSALVKRLQQKNVRGGFDLEKQRSRIDSSCDTQARLKVVRQLGIKPSYTLAELARPFFCARLVFTAKAADPATQALFDQKVADSFLGASAALYGQTRAAGQR
jgi:hypothetical protein